jgi:hypothetical protein
MAGTTAHLPGAVEAALPKARSSRLVLRIGDITMALRADDPALRLGVDASTASFVVAQGAPDVTVTAGFVDSFAAPEGELLFDSGSLWRLYRSASGAYRFRCAVEGRPFKEGVFTSDFSRGHVDLVRERGGGGAPVNPLEYPLDELLMIALMGRRGGAVVHACGVVDARGAGHLFVGHSGAGKTTMAQLWRRHAAALVLSDDRIVLRRRGRDILMYGTPWHGEGSFGRPDAAPLSAVHILVQGPSNGVEPLGAAVAVERLFACSFPPFYSSAGLERTLGFLADVAARVPCAELSFVPDERVVAFVQG